MKKKLFIGLISVIFIGIVIGIAMFCVNPPIPERLVKEELPLDHANKCLKVQ